MSRIDRNRQRQGISPWVVIGWIFVGGLCMVGCSVVVGGCGLVALVAGASAG